jgi:hypothetical protein
MKSALRRRVRNSVRSAPLVIDRDEPPFVVEPSLAVTKVAKTGMLRRLSGGKVDVSAGTYRFLHDNYL